MPNHKKAFTLIELLVVISIIALLLAILIPGLQKAKEVAASVVCLSNQKQLGLAYTLFSQSNNDELVEARPWDNGYVTVNGQKYKTFVGRPQGYQLESLDGRIESLQEGGLWPYLESHEVFNCPFDRRWKKPYSGNPNWIGGYRSYSIGGVLSHVPISRTAENKYAITKYSQFTNPSSKFVFLEETDNESPYNGNYWNMYLNEERWYDPMAVVHNDSSTFAYADGHADKFKWTDKNMIEMSQGIPPIKQRPADKNSDDYFKIKNAYIPKK